MNTKLYLRPLLAIYFAVIVLSTSCGNQKTEQSSTADSTSTDSSFGKALGVVMQAMSADSTIGGIYLPSYVNMIKSANNSVLNLSLNRETCAYLGKTSEGKVIELKGQNASLTYSLLSKSQKPEPGISNANGFISFYLNEPCPDCKVQLQTSDKKTTIVSGGFIEIEKTPKVQFLTEANSFPSFFEEMSSATALTNAMEAFANEHNIVQDFNNSYLSNKGAFVAVKLAGRVAVVFMELSKIPKDAIVLSDFKSEEIANCLNMKGFLYPKVLTYEIVSNNSSLDIFNAGL